MGFQVEKKIFFFFLKKINVILSYIYDIIYL
jgi:hypothetical protein